uniref:Tetratricopeptide repeat domain 34 n=1 Tax=Spermophilus dauricus TaxID=99837 RepID=A0A8C9QR19_SPEDA
AFRESPSAARRQLQAVLSLATMLMELDVEDENSQLLAADALYRLGRLDDAHKSLLVTLSRRPQGTPVLARLALLQLRRGFSYDANQVRRLRCTTAGQPTLDIFRHEDRLLLQSHCHARALSILRAKPSGVDREAHTREAIAYLSLAIFAAGTEASESLLVRARCYGLLGQKKTAVFDFNSVLRAKPGNVQALCGRALVYLALEQLQDAVDDVISALKLDPGTVVPEIRSLRPEAQVPLTQGLHSRCRALLSQTLDMGVSLGDEDTQGLLAVGQALTRIDATQPSWHLLLVDTFLVLGSYEEASAPLQEALCPTRPPEAARARRGLLQLKKADVPAAVQDLQCLAEVDAQDLRFLLQLLEASERHSVAQVCTDPRQPHWPSTQHGPWDSRMAPPLLEGPGTAGQHHPILEGPGTAGQCHPSWRVLGQQVNATILEGPGQQANATILEGPGQQANATPPGGPQVSRPMPPYSGEPQVSRSKSPSWRCLRATLAPVFGSAEPRGRWKALVAPVAVTHCEGLLGGCGPRPGDWGK